MASKKSSYPRGRRPISNAPGGGNYAEKWHQKLDYLEKPKRGKPKEIRIVGGIFTIFQHFVRFKRKDGSKGGFYEVCPDFDWDSGEFRKGPAAVCPLCADFQADDLPQELRLLGSFRYYMDVFDISAAKEGRKDVFGVVFTNKYGKNDLAMIGDIMGVELDDPQQGSSVLWHYDEKAPDPKDRVRFYQGNKIPVGFDDDKGLFVLRGGGMSFTGEPTAFDEIVEIKDPSEIRSDLTRLGLYARLEEVLKVIASRDEDTSTRRAEQPASAGGWGEPAASAPPPPQERPQAAPPPAAPPKDESWGEPAASAPLETAPADGGWGTEAPASSGNTDAGWGTEAPASGGSADAGWGTDSGNNQGAASTGDSWGTEAPASPAPESGKGAEGGGADFDNSFFGEEGWGTPPSSDGDAAKETAAAPAAAASSNDDDPNAW